MFLSPLTQEEVILHFYAALVQQDLDAYHASVSRNDTNWKCIFGYHLVCMYSSNSLYNLSFHYIRHGQ